MVRAVLIAALALLAFAPGASAAAPSLVSVTQAGGKVAATWTLPAAGQAWTIEVSKSSAVDSDGYFLTNDVVDTEIFVDTRTSWTSDTALPAGTYYVHLSGADLGCGTCPVPEWSAVKTVVVGGTTSGSGSSSGSSSGSTGSGSTGSTSGGSTGSTGSTGSSSGDTTSSTPTGGTTDSPSTPVSTPAAAYGTVSKATARLRGSLATVAFSVCGSGDVDVTVAVVRGKASHTAVVTLPLAGCTSYTLRLSAPPGTGKPTVSVGTGGAAFSAKS